MISIKLACFFKLFENQRLEAFSQLFSWTSVGYSKCPINKMIGLQGHLSVWAFPRVQYYIIESPFKASSVKMNEFPNQPLKRINNDFDKISLLFQFVLKSEARRPLPTAQLDFRWTLDMSDRQTDWFARTSDSLSNFFSTMYAENSFTEHFSQISKFSSQAL